MKHRYLYNTEEKDIILRLDENTCSFIRRTNYDPLSIRVIYPSYSLNYFIEHNSFTEISKEEANRICKEWYQEWLAA